MADQKTTRIYMVRHGATQLSAEDRFAGAVDVELSDEEKFQAARLAERLADDPIAAVYCSPLPAPFRWRPSLQHRAIFPSLIGMDCAK